MAMRESRGMISSSSPTCLPLSSGISRNIPVILPPGRPRLLAYPFAMGSFSKSIPTMGMLAVALLQRQALLDLSRKWRLH